MKVTLRCHTTHQPEHNEVMGEHTADFDHAQMMADTRAGHGANIILRDGKTGSIKGALILDAGLWAEIERKIIEAHLGRVQAQMMLALRHVDVRPRAPAEKAQAGDREAAIRAVQMALNAECFDPNCAVGKDAIEGIADAVMAACRVDPKMVTAAHAGLIREHTELQQKFSDLTGRYEALARDCHGDYSASKSDGRKFVDEAAIVQPRHVMEIVGREASPLGHVMVVRVPRSGDMADVVAAQVRQPED